LRIETTDQLLDADPKDVTTAEFIGPTWDLFALRNEPVSRQNKLRRRGIVTGRNLTCVLKNRFPFDYGTAHTAAAAPQQGALRAALGATSARAYASSFSFYPSR